MYYSHNFCRERKTYVRFKSSIHRRKETYFQLEDFNDNEIISIKENDNKSQSFNHKQLCCK